MSPRFQLLIQSLAAWRVRVRRRRNWRAAAASAAPAGPLRPALAALVLTAGGAVVIGSHALRLAARSDTQSDGVAMRVYRDVLPGALIAVPDRPGAHVAPVEGGTVLALNGMQGQEPVHVDLCRQLRADGRLQPLRIDARFEPLAARGQHLALLAAGEAPAVRIDGAGGVDAGVQVSWRGARVSWVSDQLAEGATAPAHGGQGGAAASGAGSLRRLGWLAWPGGALRLERRALAACPLAGELVAQLFRPVGASMARCCQVLAFSAHGGVAAGWLPPGLHQVPAASAAARPPAEDQALFEALRAHGLLRLAPDGTIAVAPRDLPAWMAAPPQERAAPLAEWQTVALDADALRLLKRLYRQADGAYVLRQIAIYNSERTLLAWRAPAAAGDTQAWQLRAADAPLAATAAMPGNAARLFADLPQGWAPWQRAVSWPQGAGAVLVHAGGASALRLMVAGRVDGVRGARVLARHAACTGKGCASAADVTELQLEPDGSGPVSVAVQPLPAMAAAGDARYRHVAVEQGRPVWRDLQDQGALAPGHAGAAPAEAGPAPAPALQRGGMVQVKDRNGALLWSDGATLAEARAAGLQAMLGVAPGHASGVAGMLARIPGGGAHSATLTLDLPLQTRAQAIVDCVALRRGRWDGAACSGGAPPPAGRQAGMVLLDAHSGAILAAAGGGSAPAGVYNWPEVRAFDRANPARSPLRIPAWQHDGGAHRSPGSTFKVVSALGLERAARTDRQLDALLEGMAPADINRMARARGYDFGTAAAAYPAGGRARITNYHEQGLEHRMQDGRLGLRQALAYSQNTWFAWAAEWSDGSLLGAPEGGLPDLQPLEPGALDTVRPVTAAARRLGFGVPMRLDGGLLPPAFRWSAYDVLQATPSQIDPVQTRHEVRQMAIGLRMQATPLQMALVAGAVGEGATVAPRLLQALNGRPAQPATPAPLDVRLDRIRAGMKGVIDSGTAAGAFSGAVLAGVRRGLYGKTGTAPNSAGTATVWFIGWLEPDTLPEQRHRLAFAVFASHSEASGGEHAAPVMAALLADLNRIGGIEGKKPAYPSN